MDDERTKPEQPVTDDDLQALADDSLEEEQRDTVLSAIIRSPELMARYLELRQQKKTIRQWWEKFHKEH